MHSMMYVNIHTYVICTWTIVLWSCPTHSTPPPLHPPPQVQINEIVDCMYQREYRRDHYICREGGVGTQLYVIAGVGGEGRRGGGGGEGGEREGGEREREEVGRGEHTALCHCRCGRSEGRGGGEREGRP